MRSLLCYIYGGWYKDEWFRVLRVLGLSHGSTWPLFKYTGQVHFLMRSWGICVTNRHPMGAAMSYQICCWKCVFPWSSELRLFWVPSFHRLGAAGISCTPLPYVVMWSSAQHNPSRWLPVQARDQTDILVFSGVRVRIRLDIHRARWGKER